MTACPSTYTVDPQLVLACDVAPEDHKPANVFLPKHGPMHHARHLGYGWTWTNAEADRPTAGASS